MAGADQIETDENVEELTQDDIDVLSETDVYSGFHRFRVVTLRHRRFAGDWSETLERELFVPRNAVGVLLYDPLRSSVVLVEQFRIGCYREAHPWALEIVAGIIEAGEQPEDVALRESVEEAGCQVTALMKIASYFSSPGNNAEQLHLFAGCVDSTQAQALAGLADEHEDIRVHVLPVADAVALLAAGKIVNSHAIIALQWLQLNQTKVDLAWQ
jgi:ADP-ribose pyrophosphatase